MTDDERVIKLMVAYSLRGSPEETDGKIEAKVGRERDGSGFFGDQRDMEWFFDDHDEACDALDRVLELEKEIEDLSVSVYDSEDHE